MLDETAQEAQQAPADPRALLAQLQAIAAADNLAESVEEDTLTEIGKQVCDHYTLDKGSMSEWQERMDKALDLAMLQKDEKTYPWENASNVIFPLVTSAALQYNARAYPAIVPSADVVKVKINGSDPQGMKAARGKRVSEFMTHQLIAESREWERGTDQLLMQLPIVGDAFRKMWWDPEQGKVRSQIRLPGKHVVVNNNATSIGTAPRISDKIELYPYQIETKVRAGLFIDPEATPDEDDNQAPVEFIEQHMRYDLDGDGYDEPYIVTVHEETQKVVRIVACYDPEEVQIDAQGQVLSIKAQPYFVHYQFMPCMDGGLLGTGLGLLLGDISDTINSTINLIMDSGHMQALGGGFIAGRDFRLQGGVHRRKPGEYRQVNFYGDDIRKGIVDHTPTGSQDVLFSMLGMLIEAGREIASVKDVMTGEQMQANMPVGTVMALIEQGERVFTASYKRVYRALSDEFQMLCGFNERNLDPAKYSAFFDEMQQDEQGNMQPVQIDPAEDFNLSDMDVLPVADPNSVTSMQKMGKAQFVLELAQQGQLDPQAATVRALEAASIEDIEDLLPKPNPQAQQQQMMADAAQQAMLVADLKLKEVELEKVMAEVEAKRADAMATMSEAERENVLEPMRVRIEELKATKELLQARRAGMEMSNARTDAGSAG